MDDSHLDARYKTERLRRQQIRDQELRHNQDQSRLVRENLLYKQFRGGYESNALDQQYRGMISQLTKELAKDKSRYTSLLMVQRPLSITEELFLDNFDKKVEDIERLKLLIQ